MYLKNLSTNDAFSNVSPSSRGLGHRPFTAVTGVRIPVGTPFTKSAQGFKILGFFIALKIN